MRTVGFTGHRAVPPEDRDRLVRRLARTLDGLIAVGAQDFYAGGAVGFDTMAALAVLDRRAAGDDVRLHLLLPFPSQDVRWSRTDREIYRGILRRADSAEYVCDRYLPGAYHLRDRLIVERSELLVAFCRRTSGGTAYTVALAEELGREIVNLADPGADASEK
ncbi:MAG: DUF1273 family protein [Oscillospiraceae bacterium]|nr:DUF1273 family protein [Oscillospiraceae bacterium]